MSPATQRRVTTARRRISPYHKAIAAFIAAFLGGVGVAAADGHLLLTEATTAFGAACVAAGAVFGVRNSPTN